MTDSRSRLIDLLPSAKAAPRRAARRRLWSRSSVAALAALAEANSPFAALYGDARLNNTHFAQFGTADLGAAEQPLMDRALAA